MCALSHCFCCFDSFHTCTAFWLFCRVMPFCCVCHLACLASSSSRAVSPGRLTSVSDVRGWSASQSPQHSTTAHTSPSLCHHVLLFSSHLYFVALCLRVALVPSCVSHPLVFLLFPLFSEEKTDRSDIEDLMPSMRERLLLKQASEQKALDKNHASLSKPVCSQCSSYAPHDYPFALPKNCTATSATDTACMCDSGVGLLVVVRPICMMCAFARIRIMCAVCHATQCALIPAGGYVLAVPLASLILSLWLRAGSVYVRVSPYRQPFVSSFCALHPASERALHSPFSPAQF